MTVEITKSDRADEFTAKLENSNLKAIEHQITIKTVEFIPMEEFNKKEIISENYKTELQNYINEKSFKMKDFLFEVREKLDSCGLYTFQMGADTKLHNPLSQILEPMKSNPIAVLKAFEEIFKDNTPPQH